MVYVSVVTTDGIDYIMKRGMSDYGEPFGFGAVGKSATEPTEESSALGTECSVGDGNYSRVALVQTFYPDVAKGTVKSEATFLETNITNETALKEFGIVNQQKLGGGTFWCICQIPTITKTSEISIKVTVISAGTSGA